MLHSLTSTCDAHATGLMSRVEVCMGTGIAFGLLMGMGVGMGITSWEWEWHIGKRSPVLNSNM